MTDCLCGFDGEWIVCIEGTVYGPCEVEFCGGACLYVEICSCTCHHNPEGLHEAHRH